MYPSTRRATTPHLQNLRSHHCHVSSMVVISHILCIVLARARFMSPAPLPHVVRTMAEEWQPVIPLSPPPTKRAHIMRRRATWVRLILRCVTSFALLSLKRHTTNELSLARPIHCVLIRSPLWPGLEAPSASLYPMPLRVFCTSFSRHALTPFEFTSSPSRCTFTTPHHL